ncbi:MAG: hypothetical protein GTO17_10390 [Candidatus Aminicenantes bacterium]|nr:hypothetical protein [Candidatus Aminicenantes bacterium]
MKLGLAQISPCLADVKRNFEIHLENIEKSRLKKVDLLVFPELSLTGYSLKDLVEEVALNPRNNPYFKKFKALSREISFILGFVEEKETGLFYNSAAFFSGGKILHIHRKIFLPTSGMFEEGKFFAHGKNLKTFDTPFSKMGMMICREFLHYGASYLLLAGGAEMIVVLSAAPGRGVSKEQSFETSRMWELMGEAISRFSSAFLVYCNRVGFEDGVVFAGGSFIYNPWGQCVARASYCDKDYLLHEIDMNEIRQARKRWPYKRDDKPEVILEALKRIVRDYED